MNYDLVNEAKCKIYNSELMKYTTTERVEKAFSKIHIYDYITDLLKAYGKSDYDNEKLEGFNRMEKAILAHMLQNIQLFMKFYIHYLANLTATDIEQ